MKLAFALLAKAADRGEAGNINLLGAGFDTLEVAELPSTTGPYTFVSRVSLPNVTQEHSIQLEFITPSGEATILAENAGVEVKKNERFDRDTTGLTMIFQFPLSVECEGKYSFRLTVNGDELTTLPLYIVCKSDQATDK